MSAFRPGDIWVSIRPAFEGLELMSSEDPLGLLGALARGDSRFKIKCPGFEKMIMAP